MFHRLAKRRLVPILVLGLVGSVAVTQEAPDATQAEEQAFRGEVSVGYVLVPAVVRSRNGFAEQLEQSDFQLRVDGTPVAVESFESGADAPLGILFLQDLSGSMGVAPKLQRSRQLIQCVLDRQRPGDEFAVASFSDEQLFVEVPFPGSPEAIREVGSRWQGYGRTALHDAIAWLPDIVHSRASPRRAVVLITDGVDNASEIDPATARDEMRQAEVPVHVVGLETGSFETLHPEGGKMYRLADMLNLIGWATGGDYYPITTRSDITAACHAMIETLRHQYVFGFATSGEGTAGRHTVEVVLLNKGKKLRIDHRRSYEGTLPRTMGSSR